MKLSDRPSQRLFRLKVFPVVLFLVCSLTPPLLASLASLPTATAQAIPSHTHEKVHHPKPTLPTLHSLPPTLHSPPPTLRSLPSTPQPLHIAQASPREQEALRLNREGNQFLSQGKYQEALERYLQALKILQEMGNRQAEGVLLLNVGDAYKGLNQYQEALRYFQQAAIVLKEVGDRPIEATAISNIGVIYSRQGQPQQAIDAFEQALAIRRALGDRNSEATILSNLANVYRGLGKFQQALELSQQALAIHREMGDRDGEMTALTNTSAIYNALGQPEKALEGYQQALAISRDLKDQSAEATLLNNLGRTYDRLAQLSKALDYYQQSLVLLQRVGDRRRESITLSNIAAIYSRQGEPNKAIAGYQQALAIAEELDDRPAQSTIINNIGALYGEAGDNKRALEYYIRSLPLLREVGKRVEEGITLGNVGTVYFELGDYANAERYLFETIQVWESLRPGLTDQNKVSLFETQAYAYRTLQETLVAQKKVDKALEVSERGRSRAFVELLATRLQGANSNSQSPVTTDSRNLKPLTIADVKQIAKEQNATLVEYSIVNNDFLYIWVVQPNGELTFQQVDLKDLPRDEGKSRLLSLIDNSRANDLSVRGRGISFVEDTTAVRQATSQIQATSKDDRPHLQKLHELLIQPIAQQLPTNPNDRVIFLPQGELFFVPFPALQDANSTYLITKHTILTAPAIQVLQLTRQQRLRQVPGARCQVPGQSSETCNLKPGTFLIVGNPTMPSIGDPPQQLSSLPGAEAEAKAIAQLLGVQPVIGAQATKANVTQRMQSARLIHMATHGLLDDYKGLGIPGAIALAPDSSPATAAPLAGLLTASEILDLKLNADLVVLSACDTGRGKITGDGVIGLSRSLITAGVTSVVVSLWKVPDDSTSFLMQQFYQNLKQPGTNKASALRKAMVVTLQQFPEPQDWAAFTIIGEAE